jgi:DNA-binding MarR family transcriptional regulator
MMSRMFDRCLYFNVNTLARIVNKKWAEGFEQFKLSPAHGYMLRVVLSNPGISQRQLADELRLEKSTITRFVDSLQKQKFVLRKKISSDAREQSIFPTAKAKKIHAALEELGENLYQAMASNIGAKNLKLLVAQLRETSSKIK